MDHDGLRAGLAPNKAADPMPVPIECKPTPTIPKVGDVPKHELSVQLIEAIVGIKQRRTKAGAPLVVGVVVIFSRTGFNCLVRHPVRANSLPKSLVAQWIAILTIQLCCNYKLPTKLIHVY